MTIPSACYYGDYREPYIEQYGVPSEDLRTAGEGDIDTDIREVWETTIGKDGQKYATDETFMKLQEAVSKANGTTDYGGTFYYKPENKSSNDSKVHNIDEVIGEGQTFINNGENTTAPINETALKNTSSTIYNILLGISMVVALAIGAFLGIKFMLASVEGKAEIKQTLMVYIIGCFIAFGAFGIWKIFIQLTSNL